MSAFVPVVAAATFPVGFAVFPVAVVDAADASLFVVAAALYFEVAAFVSVALFAVVVAAQ